MTIIWLSTLSNDNTDESFNTYCDRKRYNIRRNYGNVNLGFVSYGLHDNVLQRLINDDHECGSYYKGNYFWLSAPSKYCANHPANNTCAVFSGLGGYTWFFTSYAISIIAGSFGITKSLQTGPFSVVTTEGLFGGICKLKFLFAFFAVLTSMVTKGAFIGLSYLWNRDKGFGEFNLGISEDASKLFALFACM